MNEERKTSIIRTWAYSPDLGRYSRRASLRRALELIRGLERDDYECIYFAMANKPILDVLHCYLLIAGKIRFRMNIADFEIGNERETVDGRIMKPRYWMVLTSPVERAPFSIERRGFQGFRYTEELW